MQTRDNASRLIITITGADRPGLVAAISSVLAAAGSDLEDVSMNRLSGNFATILLARGGDGYVIRKDLQQVAETMNLHIHVEPAVENTDEPEANCFVSAAGPNRVGIVAAISEVLARHSVNITEMATRLLSRTEVPVYMVRIEGVVPGEWEALERDLQAAGAALGVELRFEPLERTDF